MNRVSAVFVLVCAAIVPEASAGRFWRHPKDVFRHPKKFISMVVRTVENQVLEPAAHAVENQVIEPVADGFNDHVIKPAARGFKRAIERHAEHDGQVAADIAHEIVVEALTGQGQTGAGQLAPKPAKRSCK